MCHFLFIRLNCLLKKICVSFMFQSILSLLSYVPLQMGNKVLAHVKMLCKVFARGDDNRGVEI